MCSRLDGFMALGMHYAMRDVKDMGPQHRMELAKSSHEHTSLGRNC